MRRLVPLVLVASAVVTACSSGSDRAEQAIEPIPLPSTSSTAATPSAVPAPSGSTGSSSSTASPSTSGPSGSVTAVVRGPYIASVEWKRLLNGRSLVVTPTASGRVVLNRDAEIKAWAEVLRQAPDARGISMYRQFSCHWRYARDKQTWNLEPWRPVVPMEAVVAAYCNPGGPE